MRDIRNLPIDLALYDTAIRGESSWRNMSALLPSWKRSIWRIGGYWLGTANYKDDTFLMTDLFLNGLGRVIKESVGGYITWQGFLGRMELTLAGITYVRDWLDICNRIKCIYTHIGDNLLTNGSAETGNWTSISGAVLAQDSTWRTDGTYSEKITANANDEGALIQASLTVMAGKGYDLTADVNITTAGTWKIEIYSGSTILASAVENTLGIKQMRCSVPTTNTIDYVASVGVRVRCKAKNPVSPYNTIINVDNVVFQEAAIKADTGWHEDLNSQAKYGHHELVLLEGSLTDQSAVSKVLTYLAKHAWARTVMPTQFGSPITSEDSLALTFYGDAYHLRQKYCSFTGSDQMDNTIDKILLETETVTKGNVAANSTSYQIDTRAPLTHWEIIQGILKAGDTNGNSWSGGCYEDHKFYYGQLSSVPIYRYRYGDLFSMSGALAVPWEVKPEVVFTDDMPVGPGQNNDTALDDPRCFVVDELEFSVADYLAGQSGLTYTREDES